MLSVHSIKPQLERLLTLFDTLKQSIRWDGFTDIPAYLQETAKEPIKEISKQKPLKNLPISQKHEGQILERKEKPSQSSVDTVNLQQTPILEPTKVAFKESEARTDQPVSPPKSHQLLILSPLESPLEIFFSLVEGQYQFKPHYDVILQRWLLFLGAEKTLLWEHKPYESKPLEQLKILKPRALLFLGQSAAQDALKTKADLRALRGQTLAYGPYPAIVTHHPQDFDDNPSLRTHIAKDLNRLKGLFLYE